MRNEITVRRVMRQVLKLQETHTKYGREQEFFDKVLHDLRVQGVQAVESLDEGGGTICRFRTHDGKKCAVGMMIPDDKYQPYWEQLRLSQVCEYLGIKDYWFFFLQLQKVHDNCETDDFPRQFEIGMSILAEIWGLNYVVQESVSS